MLAVREFFMPDRCQRFSIPLKGRRKNSYSSFQQRYLIIFCKGLYAGTTGRCQGDRSGRTPGGYAMTLAIGDTAPHFTAETTEGPIKFHDWIGGSWVVLFSHPKDFTPVCTTELGAVARLKPEFDRRNVKVVGLSVDPVTNHARWAEDIKETQGYAPNYPLIGDTDLSIS